MKRKASYRSKVVDIVQNNLILVVIWMLVVTLGAIGNIIRDVKVITDTYKNSIDVKSSEYEKLSKLSTRVSIHYFIEILGTPRIEKNNEPVSSKKYIFINKYYYVQATTDQDSNVTSFAVTTRNKDFKPTFLVPSINYGDAPQQKITLNHDYFSTIQTDVKVLNQEESIPYCYAELWPKGFTYIEGFYLGGNGEYQSYYIGINDAGNYDSVDSGLINTREYEIDDFVNFKCFGENFRSNEKFNTYMLTSNSSESALTKKTSSRRIGVASYDVRVVD